MFSPMPSMAEQRRSHYFYCFWFAMLFAMPIHVMLNVKLQLSSPSSCGCRLSCKSYRGMSQSLAPPKTGSRGNEGNGCAIFFFQRGLLMEPVIFTMPTKYHSFTKHPFTTNKFEILYLQIDWVTKLPRHHVPRPLPLHHQLEKTVLDAWCHGNRFGHHPNARHYKELSRDHGG